jgi:hypothetical protein
MVRGQLQGRRLFVFQPVPEWLYLRSAKLTVIEDGVARAAHGRGARGPDVLGGRLGVEPVVLAPAAVGLTLVRRVRA